MRFVSTAPFHIYYNIGLYSIYKHGVLNDEIVVYSQRQRPALLFIFKSAVYVPCSRSQYSICTVEKCVFNKWLKATSLSTPSWTCWLLKNVFHCGICSLWTENNLLWEKLSAGKSHNIRHQVSIRTICILLLHLDDTTHDPVVDRRSSICHLCCTKHILHAIILTIVIIPWSHAKGKKMKTIHLYFYAFCDQNRFPGNPEGSIIHGTIGAFKWISWACVYNISRVHGMLGVQEVNSWEHRC